MRRLAVHHEGSRASQCLLDGSKPYERVVHNSPRIRIAVTGVLVSLGRIPSIAFSPFFLLYLTPLLVRSSLA